MYSLVMFVRTFAKFIFLSRGLSFACGREQRSGCIWRSRVSCRFLIYDTTKNFSDHEMEDLIQSIKNNKLTLDLAYFCSQCRSKGIRS